MFHAETEDRGRVIVSYLLLFGVEAYALPDNRRLRTGGTPDCEGHFKADSEDTLAGLASAIRKSMSVSGQQGIGNLGKLLILARKLIGRCGPFISWWDITSHI